jgi:hypothetical protein
MTIQAMSKIGFIYSFLDKHSVKYLSGFFLFVFRPSTWLKCRQTAIFANVIGLGEEAETKS